MAASHSFARVNDSAYTLFTPEWPAEIKLVAANTCRVMLYNQIARKIELGFYITPMNMIEQQKLSTIIPSVIRWLSFCSLTAW